MNKVKGMLMKEVGIEPEAEEAARALHDTVRDGQAARKPIVQWVPFVRVGICLRPRDKRSEEFNIASTAVGA